MTLAEAIAKIPPGFYLKVGRDECMETGTEVLRGSLFQEPPANGWPAKRVGDRFVDQHVTSVIVNPVETDVHAFELMLVQTIELAAKDLGW